MTSRPVEVSKVTIPDTTTPLAKLAKSNKKEYKKEYKMSIMAEKTAEIVVAKGGTVAAAARKAGYSEAMVKSGKVQKTKTFQAVLAKHNEQITQRLLRLRQEAAKELKEKAKTAKYSELWSGIDTATKTIQTLTGGQTGGETPIPILNLSIHFNAVQSDNT